jgi:hypothetical protein
MFNSITEKMDISVPVVPSLTDDENIKRSHSTDSKKFVKIDSIQSTQEKFPRNARANNTVGKILIVDDEKFNCDIIDGFLMILGLN